MKNLKIGKKLLVTFGVIVALFCVTVVVSIVSLRNTASNFQGFYDNGYEITNRAMEMRRAIQSVAKNVGYTMMVTDEAQTQAYADAAQAELDVLSEGLDFLYEHSTGDQSLMKEFEALMTQGVDSKNKVFEYALKQENTKAADYYLSSYQPILTEANAVLQQIYEGAAGYADESFQSSKDTLSSTTLLLIVLSVIVLFATVMLALYITRSLTKPIRELEVAANQIVAGDLSVHIDYESRDELGSLSESMRGMTNMFRGIIEDIGFGLESIGGGDFTAESKASELYVGDFQRLLDSMYTIIDRLSRTLSQIGQAADQVTGGSEQVSSGAQALSQGATEQASSIQELAATIAEVSGQIKGSAENAERADHLAKETGDEMTRSNRQMQEMIAAMSEISDSSSEIGKIIKTIEDIAFQTNILALNAAVEAARAGAAGKGFAVVADEVRNLASKSAEASKSTSALIESSLRAVENGTKIANETATSLLEAVGGAKQVSENINLIAQASNQQAQSITQITQGVDQISGVVQTNSATAEQSAAAAEELSSQAEMLKSLLSQFKLRQQAGVAVDAPAAYDTPHYSAIGSGDKY